MILEVALEILSFTAPWILAALIALFAEMVMEP